MTIISGDVLVLTREDVTEGLLEGNILSIPHGVRRLMVREHDRQGLNLEMGLDSDTGRPEKPLNAFEPKVSCHGCSAKFRANDLVHGYCYGCQDKHRRGEYTD